MAVYTIHFARIGDFTLNQRGVESELHDWFKEVIKRYRPINRYDTVTFSWYSGEDEIVVPNHEIIV